MNVQKTMTVLLLLGVLLQALVLVPRLFSMSLPGDNTGYEPEQPIAYSHQLHAGDLQIDCRYCHFGANRSRHAGVPPASVCMNCHKFVTAPYGAVRAENEAAENENRSPVLLVSPKLQELYDYLALDKDRNPIAGISPKPIQWTKVYDLPDFVYFDHRRHVNTGLKCQECHGPVETMERVRQVGSLSMGWCVNCHRSNEGVFMNEKRLNPSTDCISCHY